MFSILLLYLHTYFKGLLRLIPVKPYDATVMITENCNSRCITCNIWKTNHTNEYSTEEFEDVMKQMRDLGIKNITFTGGEPLLRDDIGILVKRARELGFKKVAVKTNGLLLGRKAEELIESGVSHISVSVDGISETTNAIRRLPHAYHTSIEGIKAATLIAQKYSKNVNIHVSTTLIKHNIEEVPELLNVCKELGTLWYIHVLDQNPYFFQGIHMAPLRIDDNQLVDKTVDYIKTVQKKEPNLINLDTNALEYVRASLKGTCKEPLCVLAYINVYLNARGDVYPGCWVLNPVGNLRKNKLKNIVQSDAYKKRAQEMVMRKCPGCTCGYSVNVYVENLPSTLLNKLKYGLR